MDTTDRDEIFYRHTEEVLNHAAAQLGTTVFSQYFGPVDVSNPEFERLRETLRRGIPPFEKGGAIVNRAQDVIAHFHRIRQAD